MNSIGNVAGKIRNLEEANQDFINSHNESLREMIKEAEEFLKKYGFFTRGISLSDKDNLNWLLRDLSMSIEYEKEIPMMTCYLSYHKGRFSQKDKFICCVPPNFSCSSLTIALPAQKMCLAYGIGFRILREDNLKEDEECQFEIDQPFIQLSHIEKAFIYSLIIPYTRYKEELTQFCENEREKVRDTRQYLSLTFRWNQYASQFFCCSNALTTLISDFYRKLFFKELFQIWDKEIIEPVNKQIMSRYI